MTRTPASLVALTTLAVGLAHADPAPALWGPHLDLEAKPGSKRTLGELDLFLPLAQDARTLVFGNLRTRFDNKNGYEGNLGAGVRRMMDDGWNLGAYGYWDHRRSSLGNFFDQATFGVEALGRDFDLRANGYIPVGTRGYSLGTTGGGATTASIVGSSIQVTTPSTTTWEERALKGYDMEAGWRLPLFESEGASQLRLYAGRYRFADADVKVEGPRLRAELALHELPWFGQGAALFLGAEAQHDSARGHQNFLSVRLRIPLGAETAEARTLTAQERRMAAPVMRDVDIVSQRRVTSFVPAVVETATQTAGGQAITVLNSASTTGANLPAAVAAAGQNSTVILTGTFHTTATTTLQQGQTVTGSVTVRTASGRTATMTTNGTIAATGAGAVAVTMSQDSTLSHLTISSSGNGAFGVSAFIKTGVTIANNTITATDTGGNTGTAVALVNGTATLLGNTLSASGGTINSSALFMNGATATVTGNTFAATRNGGPAPRALNLQNTPTINAGSTGNVLVEGVCFNNGGVTGSIGLSGGTTCP